MSARACLVVIAAASMMAACRGDRIDRSPAASTGGNPDRGAALIRAVGCGQCHSIPGIRGAEGAVGPPLTQFARRTFIAGQLPNSPDNLVRWLMDPPAVEPGTAMPALGLSAEQARDIAAYLYAST
jgi:cytochrome c